MQKCMWACIFQKPQKLTSQHHLNTRLRSLIKCEHAAKSWGSTTSISLSYRLAKSKAPTLASLQIAEWRSTTRTARSTVRRPPPPPTTTTRTRNRTRRDTSRPTTRLPRLPLPLEQVARRPDLESVTMISNSSRRRALGPNLPKFWLLVCLMSHR